MRLQVALQGVPGIKKVSIRETKIMLPDAEAAEGFRNENTWVLDTEGTNLLDVSCPLYSHSHSHLLPLSFKAKPKVALLM